MTNKEIKKTVKAEYPKTDKESKPTFKYAPKSDRQNIVKLSYGMSGKMFFVLSLSTNCINCPRCIQRHKNEKTICSGCYAFGQLEHTNWKNTNMIKSFDYNANVLTNRVLTESEYKAIAREVVSANIKNNTDMFRLESFGDLHNDIHALNYWLICSAIGDLDYIYHINVAWWTKNYDYLCNGFLMLSEKQKASARKVTSIVLSSVFVNLPISDKVVKKVESILGMRVKTFTVYKKDKVETDNIYISCGSRDCHGCRNCYLKIEDNPNVVVNVNELFK